MAQIKYKLAIILSGIFAGLIGAFVKLIGSNMHGLSINFMRMLLATLTVAAIVPFYEKDFLKINKKEATDYAIVGFLIASTFSLFVLATQLAPVSNVVLIGSTYVIFTAIISFLFLKEKINNHHLIAIIIALAGLFILNPFIGGKALGNYFAVGQAIGFATMLAYMRKVEKTLHIKSIFWFFLFATIFLLPFAIYFGLGNIAYVIKYIIPLGIISTGITYYLLAYGLQKTPAGTTAILNLVTFTISSVVFAALLAEEVITYKIFIAGALLIFAGILAGHKHAKHHFWHP